MNRQERRKIITQIGDIIETVCGACEIGSRTGNRTDNICLTSCKTGKELQRLGNLLDPSNKPKQEVIEVKKIRDISKEEIVALKDSGKSDPEVQKILGISHMKLNELKREYDLIGKYPKVMSGPRKPREKKENNSTVLPVERDNYDKETIVNLKRQVEKSRAELEEVTKQRDYGLSRIAQLENLVNELAEEKDNLTAACEDLEKEVSELKGDVASAIFEAMLNPENIDRLENENKALRQLLKVVL